ncbi:hypothetical protein EDB84DRAFT_1437829 [Lactarius hengduanensis]|nr:hypothetical protein EDB85DRAFT_1899003 [Lactarius pseudohatsudake]KAH9035808.1 hypothetical protein EDB84DRAFT_1437829 [Lactarius hengduanensis]
MASRTGHNDIDPATRAPVPKASERDSPHCDSATAVGGGRPKVVRGRRRRRHGERSRGLQPGEEGHRWRTHLDDDRVYRASLHSQDSTKDSLPLPSYPAILFSDPTLGAKSGLTVTRRRVYRALPPENEARQANENESLRRGSNRIISATRQGRVTSTPTETTRRHAKVAREGCRGERRRKEIGELEIEDTRQEEGGATDAPTEETRRHAEVAREGRCEVRAPKSRTARSGTRAKREMEMAAVIPARIPSQTASTRCLAVLGGFTVAPFPLSVPSQRMSCREQLRCFENANCMPRSG